MNPVFNQLASIFPGSKEKLIQYSALYHRIEVPAKTALLPPAEKLLNIFTGHDLETEGFLTRWIQVGEMAGPSIRLSASTLRSSGIELCGQGGGGIPGEIMAKIPTIYLPEIFRLALEGKITIETDTVALKDIENAWLRKNEEGKRIVVTI